MAACRAVWVWYQSAAQPDRGIGWTFSLACMWTVPLYSGSGVFRRSPLPVRRSDGQDGRGGPLEPALAKGVAAVTMMRGRGRVILADEAAVIDGAEATRAVVIVGTRCAVGMVGAWAVSPDAREAVREERGAEGGRRAVAARGRLSWGEEGGRDNAVHAGGGDVP